MSVWDSCQCSAEKVSSIIIRPASPIYKNICLYCVLLLSGRCHKCKKANPLTYNACIALII